jgi:hypothetical protein
VTQQQQQQQQQQVADPGGATLVDAAPSDAAAAAQPPSQQLPPPQHPGMEESFVVLPGSSSNGPAPRQAMAVAQAADTSAAAAAAAAVPQQQQQQARQPAGGLNSKLDALAALFELASTATRVDHPLCLDCGAALKEEVAASLRELEAETAAYETALAALDAEPPAQDEVCGFGEGGVYVPSCTVSCVNCTASTQSNMLPAGCGPAPAADTAPPPTVLTLLRSLPTPLPCYPSGLLLWCCPPSAGDTPGGAVKAARGCRCCCR